MPFKRKDSAVWWVSLTDPSGKRVRRSTGTTDKREADALESKWRLEAYRVRNWDEQPSGTFEELMVQYLKSTEKDKRSADKDRTRARNLRQSFAGKTVHELSAKDVRAYVVLRKEQGRSNATINRDLALLSAAINFANREWDWDIPNVARGRKLKEAEGRDRWLSAVERDHDN
jgi:integrase